MVHLLIGLGWHSSYKILAHLPRLLIYRCFIISLRVDTVKRKKRTAIRRMALFMNLCPIFRMHRRLKGGLMLFDWPRLMWTQSLAHIPMEIHLSRGVCYYCLSNPPFKVFNAWRDLVKEEDRVLLRNVLVLGKTFDIF
jgi:hypothetical protein